MTGEDVSKTFQYINDFDDEKDIKIMLFKLYDDDVLHGKEEEFNTIE